MSANFPPLARRLDGLQSSAIRDLLKLTSRADLISLAGGLPDAELMPRDRIAVAADAALSDRSRLQYTESPGWGPLREVLAARESGRLGRGVPVEEIFVTHGSQQALSLLSEVLLDPGALVVVEDPAYVGALQVFRAAGARITAVPLDADGMRLDALRELLAAGERPAVVHTVSNFHNPGGVTLSPERRRELANLAEQYGFWIIEGDPYGELWFDRPAPAPVAAYSPNVIRLSSASKILAPSLRVGWMIAPAQVCRAVELLKQGADLCGSALTQQITADLLADTDWLAAHVDSVRQVYGDRARALVDAVRARFGDRVISTDAAGGMFVWVDFADGTDTQALLPQALDAGVAYVPGNAFAVSTDYTRSMRLCFTTSDAATLGEAVDRLSEAHAAVARV
ncbi:PLP-dependent aminotransferase family protein [Nocardia seriolae]|uniref:2-aminoadipate transaminase n=1 Tax=Nocardia seriolae TaxID=37332 RepID=A0A0B8NHE5_9NOCA|nr:PLP-dependent aminotransferase family protein [Nocardia seriolae]APB01345.1 2-aminoadipate transaminase [Nocardia seriolae]MTJ61158.1 aminotransferase class I/II-fold pyridoxal phosphate-dependent enzyme [Nocardia seriolae]MTJ74393.1 aminotransferase class I/II-fold pyridoxal phosphate-dependent enzyme [Nocardia seriolae]MTJ90716.1 aminotransferase class I/II-fold pyridoxal phosphate-dependent enzyme [Nocardia seriolae]MTK34675.1 aminotransferase class I/II-fold pyridoxal phosphate-dependen